MLVLVVALVRRPRIPAQVSITRTRTKEEALKIDTSPWPMNAHFVLDRRFRRLRNKFEDEDEGRRTSTMADSEDEGEGRQRYRDDPRLFTPSS